MALGEVWGEIVGKYSSSMSRQSGRVGHRLGTRWGGRGDSRLGTRGRALEAEAKTPLSAGIGLPQDELVAQGELARGELAAGPRYPAGLALMPWGVGPRGHGDGGFVSRGRKTGIRGCSPRGKGKVLQQELLQGTKPLHSPKG